MGWIFEKLVEIIAQAISFLLMYFSVSVTNIYGLKGSQTLDYFFGVFNGSPDTAGQHDAGAFGQVYEMFLYIGLAIIFLGMLYNLFKAFFGPLAQAEPPTKTILKAIVFATLCGFSQGLVAIIIDITQIPFDAIAGPLQGAQLSIIADHMGKLLWNAVGKEIGTGIGSNILSNFGGTLFSPSLWEAVVCIILFIMLFKNMLMLILEMAERYLMIGILTIIAPLCIACGAVKAVEDVFKNWLAWMINACVVLIFNTFFMCIFIFNFIAYCDVPYLCLWIAWVKTGQKIDEHMNALGLKTAKTGGFGADVMGALITGLPMALGAADKFAGTNMAGVHQWAKRGMQGPMPSLKTTDARAGERENNLSQKMLESGLNKLGKMSGKKSLENMGTKAMEGIHKTNEAMAIKSGKTMGALESMLPGHNDKVSSRRGFKESELNDMMTGKKAMPAKGTPAFDETMKDMMDMKGGKGLTDELEKKGYSITGMSQDGNGNVSFSAEDQNGNKIVGSLSDGAPERNSGLIGVQGEDGQMRGLAVTDTSVEGKENPLDLAGLNNMPSDDRSVAALAGSEAMTTSGEVASENMAQIGDNKYNLSEPDESGVMTGVNTEDPNDVRSFAVGEDGSLVEVGQGDKMAGADISGGTITDGNETMQITASDGNGNIEATDADGNTRNFQADGNGGLQELVGAEAQTTESSQMSFNANGHQFTTDEEPAKNGIFSATNENGETQAFYKDKQGNINEVATKDANGVFSGGAQVASADDISRSTSSEITSATVGGASYSLSKNADGTYTGTDASGNQAQFKQTPNGLAMIQDSSAKVSGGQSISVSDSSGNTFQATSNGNGTYTSTNSVGQKSMFSIGADGSAYRTAVSNESGGFTSTREQTGTASYIGSQASDGVTVRTADGDYVRTEGQQRYDQYGNPSINGNYMATMGADGSKNFVEVATNNNGTIPTYQVSQEARQTRFETPDEYGRPSGSYMSSGDYVKNFGDTVDHQYAPANGSSTSTAATNIMKGSEMYSYNSSPCLTADGQLLQQRYIRNSDGGNDMLDMSRCTFDSNGYLVPGSEVYVVGNPNPVNFDSGRYMMNSSNNNASMPRQYVDATNTRNGETSSIELHGATECYASGSYVNGVPTNINWDSATLRSGASQGYSDSAMIAEFSSGEKVMVLPATARTEGLQGVYAKLPMNLPGSSGASGQDVFIAAIPSTRMQSALNGYFAGIGKDAGSISSPVDITNTNTKEWKLLSNEFGIPSKDVKNVRYVPNSQTGPIIQYSQNVDGRLRHYVVSATGFEGKSAPTPIKSNTGNSIVAYRQEISQGEPLVAKATRKNPMRVFHRKNIFPEEERSRR